MLIATIANIFRFVVALIALYAGSLYCEAANIRPMHTIALHNGTFYFFCCQSTACYMEPRSLAIPFLQFIFTFSVQLCQYFIERFGVASHSLSLYLFVLLVCCPSLFISIRLRLKMTYRSAIIRNRNFSMFLSHLVLQMALDMQAAIVGYRHRALRYIPFDWHFSIIPVTYCNVSQATL